jgi:hypothetical protein
VRKDTNLVAETLTAEDRLRMPEIGVEVPMTAFYPDIELPEAGEVPAE